MLNYVFGRRNTLAGVANVETTLFRLDLPGNQLRPQDWVIISSLESECYRTSTNGQRVGFINFKRNADPEEIVFESDVAHQNVASAADRSHLNHCAMFYIKDHTGEDASGVHNKSIPIIISGNAPSAPDRLDASNVRILAIRLPKDMKGRKHLFSSTTTASLQGGVSIVHGGTTFTPYAGTKYLVISTTQLVLVAGTGRADLRFEISETDSASTEAGATDRIIETIPLDTVATATLGHYSQYEAATAATKHAVTTMTVMEGNAVPTTLAWKVESLAATGAGSQVGTTYTVAIPLDGNFVYDYVKFPGIALNTTTTYDEVVDAFSFGVTGKNTFLMYMSHITASNIDNSLDAALFPAGSTTGAHSSVHRPNTPGSLGAYESTPVQGTVMFTGSDSVDLAFREAVASPGNAIARHTCILALRDEQSQQTDETSGFDINIEYDIEGVEKTNIFDLATTKALLTVADESEPVGVRIKPHIVLPKVDTVKILAIDTFLYDPNASGP